MDVKDVSYACQTYEIREKKNIVLEKGKDSEKRRKAYLRKWKKQRVSPDVASAGGTKVVYPDWIKCNCFGYLISERFNEPQEL